MQTSTRFTVQRGEDRAFFDHGWLRTYHSFSFAEYQDPLNVHWGALRVANDDVIAAGQGFGEHPHRDMEILTYVFEGELEHKDSMGNIGVVGPGGMQYLSAGTGITHSEYNHSSEMPCRILQMWIVPSARNLAPRYGQVDFAIEDRRERWLRAVSGNPAQPAPIAIWQDATCSVARLEGGSVPLELADDRLGFLFVGEGRIEMTASTGERLTLERGDAVRCAGPVDGELSGNAELVFWDIPPLTE